ncbi:MHYT domain-containing protein [Bosea sp. RAC05]|uniref:MHYT domain-containing protein n=1 Tax=Bosea sp. RAC05 TaxID=1842539 RepID=UPI00083DD93C|nr:MHYT domain-containing protein [Bosea sp. RAC05]AOG03276.1 sensory box protein [Bosea sp. RAC05]
MIVSASHPPVLVTLSVVMALLASYTALDLSARARESGGTMRAAWLATSAVVMGGGIWTMHFLGMLALQLPVAVEHDFLPTLFSLLSAVGLTGAAFAIVTFAGGSWVAIMAAGFVMTIGIVSMHYISMAGIIVDAQVIHGPTHIAFAVVAALVSCIVALWVAFRPSDLKRRVGAAMMLGFAVSAMHYVAQSGVSFICNTVVEAPERLFGPEQLALVTVFGTLLILATGLGAAAVDRHVAAVAGREAVRLRESERQFRSLVDAVPDYAIYMLDEAGVIVNWNAGAEALFGYRAGDVLGRSITEFHPDARRTAEGGLAMLDEALRVGRFEEEGWRQRKDGSPFYAASVVFPVFEDGKLVGFSRIVRDVTRKHQAEICLEETRAQLVQSQKVEALGQLTGGIAHDFNNLLTIVLGNLEFAERGFEAKKYDRARKNVTQALDGAQRAAALTRRLLAFARQEPLAPEVIEVNELMLGMVELLRQSIGSGIRLETDFTSQSWSSLIDPSQLENAIVNLAVNGKHAMDGRGLLSISTRNVTLDEVSCRQYLDGRPGEFVRICVSDTGAGMDSATLSKVFEPFFTTKGPGVGTGLGLSMVHGFVRQSEGLVRITSTVGEGTCVEILLPRHVQQSDAEQTAPALSIVA